MQRRQHQGTRSRLIGALRLLLPALLAIAACRQGARLPSSRAGEAIAIEVRHTAVSVARRAADRVDPACGSFALKLASGPVAVSVVWHVEGARGGRSVLELEERRRLEIDGRGRARYRREAIYRSELGQRGRRWREWRIIDGQIYTRDLNLPFERRPIDVAEVADRLREAPEVFSTLVELTGGAWTDVRPSADGWTLTVSDGDGLPADGRPIRCGGLVRRDPWLGDLLGQLVVQSAEAEVVTGDPEVGATIPARRAGRWVLASEGVGEGDPGDDRGRPQSLRLQVDVEERVEPVDPAEPIEVPDEVFDVMRPRPYRSVERLLEAIDALETSD